MTDLTASWVIRRGLSIAAKDKLLTRHYLKRLPPTSRAFTLTIGDEVMGVVTFGVPASRHLQISACPSDPSLVLELNRLWLSDDMPSGSASMLISRVLKQMPMAIIVSYADTTAGHHGGVYRACNFFYAGWTDMERKTPRYDYVVEGKHSRDAFRSGGFTRVRRKPKVKYWIVTGDRRERREALRACPWPKLDWKVLPPPMPITDVSTVAS